VSAQVTIALDAMGGDHAPEMVVKGAAIARRRFPNAHFMLFGNESRILPLLKRRVKLKKRVTIHHTEVMIADDMKPSMALRNGRNSSMLMAIEAVREGQAAGVVSAGNTGALMALSKMSLKMLPGIDRPAMAAIFPTERGESVMLDLGANLDCDARNLMQFGVMGAAFARTVLGVMHPKVGLLNVGTEEPKGNNAVREAAAGLRASELPLLDFLGFVEGDDIGAGTVDVIVSDGFSGNIALKTLEGSVKLYTEFLRHAFRSSLASRLGYILARRALKKLRARVDPRRYNGAMFVGLNGIVVKSHGGTDAFGFANAIGVTHDLAVGGFNDLIIKEIAGFGASPQLNARVAAS
jgi:phosphate acyltransferase